MKLINFLKYVSTIFLIITTGTGAIYAQKATAQQDGSGALLQLEQSLQAEWKANEGNVVVQDHLHEAAKDVRSALCGLGREDYCPLPEVDMDALAEAVACHESACGTSYSARVRNNFHGIMYWPNGVRKQRTFASKKESYDAFKKLWTEKFGVTMPTIRTARTYSGNDNAQGWLDTVTKKYYQVCKRAKNCPNVKP